MQDQMKEKQIGSEWGGSLINDLRKILLKHPKINAARYGLAIVNIIDNNLDEAAQNLCAIIEEFPDMALIHRRLAEIFIYQSQHEKAIKHLEKAVTLDNSDLTSLTWLSLIYHRLGDKEKALSKQDELETYALTINVSQN